MQRGGGSSDGKRQAGFEARLFTGKKLAWG